MKMNQTLKKTVFAAMFLALCMVLPLITMQIPQIGKMLSPMHIPVLLCGFVCGWPYGLIVGLIAPIMRSLLFQMPAFYPDAIVMTFELGAYGLLAGVLYRAFPKKNAILYLELLLAMIGGRLVWGAAKYIVLGLGGSAFSFEMFLSGAVLKAIPGIVLQIVLIPPLVMAFKKTKLIED